MTGTEPFVDRLLDLTLVGYTRLGPAVRRRLPGWPDDPPAGALAGKHVAITGASSGLGEACARQARALPVGEVRVLQRQRRQVRRAHAGRLFGSRLPRFGDCMTLQRNEVCWAMGPTSRRKMAKIRTGSPPALRIRKV